MNTFAQIPDFSQIYTNYVYLNPAFVGISSCPHVYTSFRAKNISLESYKTAYLSFDIDMNSKYGSFGFSLLQDVCDNNFKSTEFLSIYAKTFQLQKNLFVKASLAAGYVYNSTNYSDLIFSDMLSVFTEGVGSSAENFDKIVRHNFNSEMGVLIYNDIFYAGMTIKNLQGNVTDRNKDENLLPRTFSFHGMAKFSTTKAYTQKYLILFYPHVNAVLGSTSSYAQLGLVAQKWMLQLGGAYRQNFKFDANSLSIFIGFVEKKFRFAYNCDMTMKLNKQFDTHELSLSYQFDCHEKKKRMGAVKAPMF